MTQEKRDRIEHWLNHYTDNGQRPIDGNAVTGVLKQGLGYTYNAPSMSEDIADIAFVYAQQQVKKCDLADVVKPNGTLCLYEAGSNTDNRCVHCGKESWQHRLT